MAKFNEVGDQLIEKLEKVADGKTVVNLANELHCAALDVIGKVNKIDSVTKMYLLFLFLRQQMQDIYILNADMS